MQSFLRSVCPRTARVLVVLVALASAAAAQVLGVAGLNGSCGHTGVRLDHISYTTCGAASPTGYWVRWTNVTLGQ